MDPITVAAGIAGIAGIGGGLLGNKASADEARRNRQFQRKMYRHRYQYTVEDMRRAGLNPALAYQQGGGSAPSGSMASQDDPLKGGVEGVSRAVSSALAVRQNKAQIENIQANTAKTMAEKNLVEAETPGRVAWWKQKPEELGVDILSKGMKWRIDNLTREYLDATLKGRIEVQGLEREQLQEMLTQLRQEIELRGLDRAPLEAQAEFAKTWFGQNVAPAIGSAQGIGGILGGVIAPFLRFMEERGRANRESRPKTTIENRRHFRGGSTTTRRVW